MSTARTPRSQTFPLSSLFLLIALCAVLAAHLTPLATAQQRISSSQQPSALSLGSVFAASVMGLFLGGCFGVIIGRYHHERTRGVLVGLATGVVMGALCGAILAISDLLAWQTSLISFVSAIVLLGVAAFVRYMNDEDPVARREVYEKLLAQRKEDVNAASQLGEERQATK